MKKMNTQFQHSNNISFNAAKKPTAELKKTIDNMYKILLDQSAGQSSIKKAEALLNIFEKNFNILNDQDEASYFGTMPMPDYLQESIVILVMNGKNDSSISQYDIITTLDTLPQNLKDSIDNYTKNGFEDLLKKGVELFNQEASKQLGSIALDTSEPFNHMPTEVIQEINNYLSFSDNKSLSETSNKFNNIHNSSWGDKLKEEYKSSKDAKTEFLEFPEHRKDKYIPVGKGFNYLNDLGIDGPRMIKKICEGELSINDALEVIRITLKEIKMAKNSPDISLDQRQILEKSSVQKYIVDGQLTIAQALTIKLDDDGRCGLDSQGVQKYLDNGQLTLEQALAIELNYYGRFVLDNEEVQKYLDNGKLTTEQALAIELDGNECVLDSEIVQKYLDNGKLTMKQALKLNHLGIDGPKTIKRICEGELSIEDALEIRRTILMEIEMDKNSPNISRNQRQILKNSSVEKYIVDRQLTIAQALAIKLDRGGRCGLYNKRVHKYLDNGELTMEQALAIELDDLGLCVLDSEVVQKYLDNGELTMEQALAIKLDYYTGRCVLDSEVVQKYLANGKLTLEQALAIKLDYYGKCVLDSEIVQKYLDNGELTMEQALAIKLDNYGQCVLDSKRVQSCLDNGKLTMEQALL